MLMSWLGMHRAYLVRAGISGAITDCACAFFIAMIGSMKWVQATNAGLVAEVCGGTSMLSPAWPGRWNGSGICTPCARMQGVESTMSLSLCASVRLALVACRAEPPGRFATCLPVDLL